MKQGMGGAPQSLDGPEDQETSRLILSTVKTTFVGMFKHTGYG